MSLDAPSVRGVKVVWPAPLAACETPPWLRELCRLDAPDAPMQSDATLKGKVRDMLRQGGFKPTGRNKPASEYLLKAVEEGRLGPERGINVAVDLNNVVSLHSGLPISVVDLEKVRGELSIQVMEEGASYVFNASGQELSLGGLVCLCDAQGACANAVKDAQRTKTDEQSVQTLFVIWGSEALTERLEQTEAWLCELGALLGAQVTRAGI